jgi:hypothetical protein
VSARRQRLASALLERGAGRGMLAARPLAAHRWVSSSPVLARMSRPSDHPEYNKALPIVSPKQFLDEVQAMRDSQQATPRDESLSEIWTPMVHEDPLFQENSDIIYKLRALPEPFRSKLLAKMINSLPPDHVTNLERLDPGLVRMLRRPSEVDSAVLEPDGLHPSPYMSNVQFASNYFTALTDPLQHTPRHDGRYFVFGKEEEASLFPEGLPPGVTDEFELTQRRALMVRPEVRSLVEELERYRLVSKAWLERGGQGSADKVFGGKVFLQGEDVETERSEEVVEEVMQSAREWCEELESLPDGPTRVLTGPRGCGKTCALTQVVRYARSRDWIVVYIPSAYRLTHQGQVLTPTRGRPGDYDQNDLATEILNHVLTCHGEQLDKILQRGKYRLDMFLPEEDDTKMRAEVARRVAEEEDQVASLKAEAESKGQSFDPSKDWTSQLQLDLLAVETLDREAKGYTLGHMLRWGLAHPPQATETVVALLSELRQTVEYPVLVAVDGVNDLYEPSGYPSPYGRRLSTKRLPLVRALQAFNSGGPKMSFRRGAFVGAVSLSRNTNPALLRHSPPGSAAVVPPDNRFPLQPWARTEIHSQLLHYAMTGRFPELPDRASVDAHAVDVFRTLSAGIPLEVRKNAILQF